MSRSGRTPGSGGLGLPPGRRVGRIALEARAGIAATAATAAALTTGPDHATIIGLVLVVYLPYAALVTSLERRPERAPYLLAAAADHLIVFAFAVAIPYLRTTALLGYGIATAYHTLRGGAALGATSAGLAVALAVLSEQLAPADPVGGFTLVIFAGVQLALVRVVTLLTRERREFTHRLAQLDAVVWRWERDHDHEAVLHTVATAITSVLDARGARVVLDERQSDDPCEARTGADPTPEVAEVLDRLLSGAQAVGRPVIRPTRLGRRRPWRPRRRGWCASVPLRTSDTPLGVVVAWGEGRLAPGSEAVLTALGDHAVAALVRVGADRRQREALQRLEEVEQIRDNVLTTLSHEIRTPLTATTGLLYILDTYWDRLDASVRRTMLSQARQSNEVIDRLVDRIMDFARFEHQTRLLDPLAVDLADEVRRALDRRSALLARHRVEVVVASDCPVLAVPEALDRILGNLLENAACYSPPGSMVEVRAEVEGDQVTVTVRDEGPGVDPDDLTQLFDPLFRGHQPRPGVRGTGIGLTVVRRLVELLGGRVWVESDPGVGATFAFTLSLAAEQARTGSSELLPHP